MFVPPELYKRETFFSLDGFTHHYPKIDIDKRCSYIVFEQLRNENLRPSLEVGSYGTTTCELSGADTVSCTGRVNVQDYIQDTFIILWIWL